MLRARGALHVARAVFAAAVGVDDVELGSLCRTYEKLDDDGRRIITAMASQVVAQTCATAKRLGVIVG